jgi:hypothetical protein
VSEDLRYEKIASAIAELGIPGITMGHKRVLSASTVTVEQARTALVALSGCGCDVEPMDAEWLMEKGSLEI